MTRPVCRPCQNGQHDRCVAAPPPNLLPEGTKLSGAQKCACDCEGSVKVFDRKRLVEAIGDAESREIGCCQINGGREPIPCVLFSDAGGCTFLVTWRYLEYIFMYDQRSELKEVLDAILREYGKGFPSGNFADAASQEWEVYDR